jgi:hypothetical protein
MLPELSPHGLAWTIGRYDGVDDMEAVAALISGAVLAFKHPKAFALLYPYLNLLVSVAFLSASIWQGAVHVTWTGVRPLVEAGQLDAALLVKASLTLPYFWICVAYAVLMAFFWVILKLPMFVKKAGADAE